MGGYHRSFVSDSDTSAENPDVRNVGSDATPDEHVKPAWAPIALMAWIALVICTNVAAGGWARWVDSNPEMLLALSSRNRYLALTLASGVPLPTYVVIATLRIGAAFIICYLIGYAYADQAAGWFRRYLGFTKEAEAAFERGFDKAEWALIPIFAGSNIVAVLTGIRRTPPRKMLGLLAIGIIGRLVLMWWLARAFEEQLLDFLEWVAQYQLWIIAASIGLVVLVNAKNLRRR